MVKDDKKKLFSMQFERIGILFIPLEGIIIRINYFIINNETYFLLFIFFFFYIIYYFNFLIRFITIEKQHFLHDFHLMSEMKKLILFHIHYFQLYV